MNDTDTLTLAEFLLARFADDVEDACKMAGLKPDGTEDWAEDTDGFAVSPRMTRIGFRVLADCEAKRRIVALHPGHYDHFSDIGKRGWECGTCGTLGEYGVDWPCPTLQTLALPYADHPDYRQEWKP